ncbi:MAG: ASKHA domain-containing protein, partial [Pseudomonadota bacterium]
AVVQDALGRLIIDVCEQAACDRSDVLECVIVGNPVMHHLLLGWSPVELGWAPFALVSNQAQDFPLCQLGSAITDHAFNPGAHSWVLPLIAGHVGADAAAVILSEAPQMQDAITLIVDIGTNAEIILGSKARLLACSSPTGPALEGAQISSGQRAAAGAIERVRIDPDTLEPRFKVIGCDRWSNEDGFDDLVAATGVTGICGSGIIEVLAELYLTRIIDVDGRIAPLSERPSARLVQDGRTWCYVLNPACEAKGWPEIRITQNDVRAIQLAKAALYAGAQLLVDRLGQKPERIILAGAFGSHIDPKSAMILGMIPDCDLKQVRQAGNAAGTGARIALLNHAARLDICKLVRTIEKIETATEARFQEHFVEAMAFPHKTAPFPMLKTECALPEPVQTATKAPGSKRGRRRMKV